MKIIRYRLIVIVSMKMHRLFGPRKKIRKGMGTDMDMQIEVWEEIIKIQNNRVIIRTKNRGKSLVKFCLIKIQGKYDSNRKNNLKIE